MHVFESNVLLCSDTNIDGTTAIVSLVFVFTDIGFQEFVTNKLGLLRVIYLLALWCYFVQI